MTALYELVDEFRAAADRLADLDLPPEVVADTLESLSGDIEQKSVNVIAFVRNLEATAAAIKAAEEQMSARRKAIESRAKSVRDYALRCLVAAGISKIESPWFRIAVRNNPKRVDVFQRELLPAKYLRTPPPPEPVPDLRALLEDIEAGVGVPGARVVLGLRLEVK